MVSNSPASLILAIDPGSEQSAYVVYNYDLRQVDEFDKIENCRLVENIRTGVFEHCKIIVVEMIASYGMAVGAEVFETCVNIGRLLQASAQPSERMFRKDVKMHLCGQTKAKDANIRQSLIDLWGGKEKAIGKKKTPGPLYGISGDCWAALAVAVTWAGKYQN